MRSLDDIREEYEFLDFLFELGLAALVELLDAGLAFGDGPGLGIEAHLHDGEHEHAAEDDEDELEGIHCTFPLPSRSCSISWPSR